MIFHHSFSLFVFRSKHVLLLEALPPSHHPLPTILVTIILRGREDSARGSVVIPLLLSLERFITRLVQTQAIIELIRIANLGKDEDKCSSDD